jgi:hypothetical protein
MRQNMRLLKSDFEVGCLLLLKRPASAGFFFVLPSYQIKRLNDDQAFDLCLSASYEIDFDSYRKSAIRR